MKALKVRKADAMPRGFDGGVRLLEPRKDRQKMPAITEADALYLAVQSRKDPWLSSNDSNQRIVSGMANRSFAFRPLARRTEQPGTAAA